MRAWKDWSSIGWCIVCEEDYKVTWLCNGVAESMKMIGKPNVIIMVKWEDFLALHNWTSLLGYELKQRKAGLSVNFGLST